VEVGFCSLNEVSDEKRRAPVDGSCAQAHLMNPKMLGSDEDRCAGLYAFTQRALRSYGARRSAAYVATRDQDRTIHAKSYRSKNAQ
jgi:hypothetical protein